MKNIFLITFLIIFNFCSAQNISGIINYNGYTDISVLKQRLKSDSLNVEDKEDLKKIIPMFGNKLNYKLKFNEDASLFIKIEELDSDNNEMVFNKLLGEDGIIYTNKRAKKVLRQVEAFGELLLIDYSKDATDWKLLNETLYIGEYLCYKAISKKRFVNSRGVFYKDIVAWYCPKLPFTFGPTIYNNLPGLILKIKIGKYIYEATEISIQKNKSIKIKELKKGKKMTRSEFEDFGINSTKGLFK